MLAAYYETTGGPEVLKYGEVPTPTAGPGQVLVRVQAAALNPIDTYIRAGIVNMPLPKPFVPGCDLAGVVHAVGSGVTQYKVGDQVWGSNQGLLGRQGTWGEFAAVDAAYLYPVPAGVSAQDAAASALVSITAHLGLFRWAKLQADDIVFVNGGTGGVGSMVVQQAKASGAKVITTVGSPEKADLCRRWGADCVIQYKTEDVAQKVKDFTQGKGVTVWYETQREPDFVRSVELLARRGRMIVMAGRQAQPLFPVGPFYVKDLSLFGFAMFNAPPAEQQACATDINRWLKEKKLHVPIGSVLPFSKGAEAHRLQEANTLHKAGTLTGKIVLVPG